jgi:Diadenosine tetraphosphate (Ap4A) hydrolase and other HIT family hydrolases
MDCLFCKIVNGEIPSTKLYEDDKILAFKDIAPEAPIHFLVMPKQHIASANEIDESNSDVVTHIYKTIASLASELGMQDGYRVVTNVGTNGGQTVAHLHFHVLAGRSLAWPPG